MSVAELAAAIEVVGGDKITLDGGLESLSAVQEAAGIEVVGGDNITLDGGLEALRAVEQAADIKVAGTEDGEIFAAGRNFKKKNYFKKKKKKKNISPVPPQYLQLRFLATSEKHSTSGLLLLLVESNGSQDRELK